MNKLYAFLSFAIIGGLLLYFGRKPFVQEIRIEGKSIYLNKYFDSHSDIPDNWSSTKTDNYKPNGEFYFHIYDRSPEINDSMCSKFTSIIYINDGYLKKVILIPKKDSQFLHIRTADSLYTLKVKIPFYPNILLQKDGTAFYLNDAEGQGIEITMDAP